MEIDERLEEMGCWSSLKCDLSGDYVEILKLKDWSLTW